VRRAYKLRAYPTRPQEGRAIQLLADHCDPCDAALQEGREAWPMRKPRIRYGDQSAQLKDIRATGPAGQGRHSSTAQQQTLRRLKATFSAYFKCVRAAKGSARRVGYPRFKPYRRFDQVLFVAGDGARWEPADGGRWAHATFQSVGHKTARALVDACDMLALEDLRVAAMTTSAAGTVEAPGRNVAAKAGLNRSVLDAGWFQFTSILVAKAESAGRRVMLVNPVSTSIDGHACGARCIRPRQDPVVCPVQGDLDADLNGARNIAARAGLGSGQASVA
jgi:transposase